MTKGDQIRKALLSGDSYATIAKSLCVSKSTINYHATKIAHQNPINYGPQVQLARDLIKTEHTNKEVRRATGLSITTICRLRRELGVPSKNQSPTYDWADVQKYYDAGHSVLQCVERFGFARASWAKAVATGKLKPRQKQAPLEDILIENSTYQRGHLKRRLVAEGLLQYICAECGQGPEWNGKPLTLELDHINGVNNDNRLHNLRILCPHCHSQTDTFAGRNISRKKH